MDIGGGESTDQFEFVDFDERKIDSILEPIDQCHLPGAVVGIALRGRPVYRKGFGLAHMEVPVVLSPSTRLRILSTSKHFTCLAFLLLCEDGRAQIDDPIGRHIPEMASRSGAVTVRELMGNIGGLRNPMNLRWEVGDQSGDIPVKELLDMYRHMDDINFEPRLAFDYNNSGFELIGAAIERITGQPLENVLRIRIFGPVGMHDTMLRRRDTDFAVNSATMHMQNSAGRYEKKYLPGEIAGAGGIVSTVDDMLCWMKHMDAPKVGSIVTWELMKTPQTLADGSSTGYGCGLIKGIYRGVQTLSHPGTGMGAASQMLKVPSARLDIVVMVNRSDMSALELTERILDECLIGLDPIVPASEKKMPAAVFRSRTSPLVISIGHSDGEASLSMQPTLIATVNAVELPVAFDGASTLRPTGPGTDWLKYTIDYIGDIAAPDGIKFTDFGVSHTLEVVGRAVETSGEPIVGRYVCKAIDTEADIHFSGNDLILEFSGRLGATRYRLKSWIEGVWFATQINLLPRKIILYFEPGFQSFGYISYSTHLSPLRFARQR